MLIRTKIIIAAAAIVALGGGTAGAVATASALTVRDETGVVQKLAPVTTGRSNQGSDDAVPSTTSTPGPVTTVAPAPPMYVDDHGNHTDDPSHDVGDDHGGASGSDDGNGGSGHGSDDGGSHN